MKRLTALAVLIVAFAIAAYAGPYFGVENIGVDLAPELIVGGDLEGRIGTSDWTFLVDASYTNIDLLTTDGDWMFDLTLSLGWGQIAVINQTDGSTTSLSYGANFTFTQAGDFCHEEILMADWVTGLLVEGYVGPLSLWFGFDMPWAEAPFEPTVGFFVDW